MPNLTGLTTNFFPTPNEGFTTTTSGPVDSSSATVVPLNSVSGLTNGSIYTGLIDPGNAKERAFTGVVDTGGSQITSVKFTTGTNATHTTGATVVDYVTGTHIGQITKGISVSIDQDGALKESAVREALNLGTASTSGWEVEAELPDTITYNGNRSYDLVFNSTDLTDTLSEGMRLRTTRTVSAPTQCADLEASSSQYFSKSSPAGLSFTTTFTCAAWVKLESYAIGGIIARRNGATEGWDFGVNGSGQVVIRGLRIASNNKRIDSYQSLPLNKWVYVAACLDMTAGDTTAQKIWIDGVEVPRLYTLTGTATALVQGTTALVVGAETSAGTNTFDGKIAQASVHSACLSDVQVKALMSQTISSSSPSIVSGFTLDGVLTDVSANANDLTASGGALATNTDSPFGSYLGGTLDYGIITKTAFSTNTTLTVQVPEGCTIPTSGGVSAVSYSTQDTPYLFPRDKSRWRLVTLLRTAQSTTSNANYGAYMSGGFKLNAPLGVWKIGQQCGGYYNVTAVTVSFALSPTSMTGLTPTQGADATKMIVRTLSTGAVAYTVPGKIDDDYRLTTATDFVMYTYGATTNAGMDGTQTPAEIFAEFNLV